MYQLGSIENIYSNLDKLKPAVKKSFQEASENINAYRNLIKIDCDVPIKENVDNLIMREPDNNKFSEIIEYLGFRVPSRKKKVNIQPELF